MSTKAHVQTQAKTPAAPVAASIPQPPLAVPEYEAEWPDIATLLDGAARLGHSLGAISVRNAAPPQIQAKPLIQRQELPEEDDEELQMKREPAAVQRQEIPEEEEEELQMKAEPAALQRRGRGEGFRLDDETAGRINRARGGGQPLDDAIQAQMGGTMGHDFSGVRVHTDSEADTLNQQLAAKAFTTGRDLFFRRGAYEPSSSSGRELIAHELAHVVQQGTGRVAGGGGSGLTVRHDGDTWEQEANALGERVVKTNGISPQHRTVARPIRASKADIAAQQHSYVNRAVKRLLAQRQGKPRQRLENPAQFQTVTSPTQKALGTIQREVKQEELDELKANLAAGIVAANNEGKTPQAAAFEEYIQQCEHNQTIEELNATNARELLRLAWALHRVSQLIITSVNARSVADGVQILGEYMSTIWQEVPTNRQPWGGGNLEDYIKDLNYFGTILVGPIDYLEEKFNNMNNNRRLQMLRSGKGWNHQKGTAQLTEDLLTDSWKS